MEKCGFEIWQDGQCIHEDYGYEDVMCTTDLFRDIQDWWEMYMEGYPKDYLVKIYAEEDNDELDLSEIVE